jgi:cytoskeleton protein RodZ
MNPLNVDLRLAREQAKVTLQEIADQTHITLRQLENLEEGRYDQLPGGLYNRAFLRAYCDCLGLDSAQFLARYQSEAPPSDKSVTLKPRDTRSWRPRRPLNPVAIWSAMLLVSIGSLLHSRHWIAEFFAPYFSRSQEIVRPQLISEPREPARSQPVAELPRTQPPASRIESPPASASIPAALPVSEPKDEMHPSLKLEFEVVQPCWVSVSRDGNRVLVKMLQPGDDLSFEAEENFYVILGNAGGVRLKINGKRAKPPGNSGEVVKMMISSANVSNLLAVEQP